MSCEFHHPPCRRYKTALVAAQRPRWRSQNPLGGVEGGALHKTSNPTLVPPSGHAGAAKTPWEAWRAEPSTKISNPTLVPPSGHAGAAETEPPKRNCSAE